jgi:hypothetical protein
MSTATHISREIGSMVNVRATEDIEFLVKESEVITGRLGRKFVIAGADRLVYLVQWHPVGFKVQRLDHEDIPTCTMFMLPGEFHAHSLGEALRAGQLFTLPVNL